jgi:polar amino acid transport system substrate-binding protein
MIFTATGIARCLLLLASLILMSCDRGSPQPTSGGASQSGGTAGQDSGWASLGDLAQAQGRIGVILGTVFAPYVEQTFPQARVTTFNSTTDQVVALKTGKVDTALFDAISAQTLIRAHPELGILDEGFFSYPLGIGFRRDRAELRERFNRFLERLRADGGYEAMQHRWLSRGSRTGGHARLPGPHPREGYVLGVSVADSALRSHSRWSLCGPGYRNPPALSPPRKP